MITPIIMNNYGWSQKGQPRMGTMVWPLRLGSAAKQSIVRLWAVMG